MKYATFVCPQCEKTERALASSTIQHPCPKAKRFGSYVEFVRVEEREDG